MKAKNLVATDKVANHLTLLYGFDEKDWPSACEIVSKSMIHSNEIVFSNEIYCVRPSHDTKNEYWCIDVDMGRSTKLLELQSETSFEQFFFQILGGGIFD
jgi:hypothetical protein